MAKDIENEIQSWIAVRSFAVENANPQAPIIDANELAEFVTEVFKKLEGCVVVPKTIPENVVERLKNSIYHWGENTKDYFSPIYEMMVEEAARGGK